MGSEMCIRDRVVIAPPDWSGEALQEAYSGSGVMVNSARFDGLPSEQGMEAVAEHVENSGWGGRTVSYRLRDWLISRQRYWGTPIPMVHCRSCGTVPVPEDQLPVLLPPDAEFKPTGESPLAGNPSFVETACPRCGDDAQRETDTMDTFVDSSWYMMRYTSPDYDDGPFNPTHIRQWLPVDQYTGGAEHAVMHLLYARFFTKALRDLGLVDFGEPFLRLYNQGTIVAGGAKMSKSRGNVVTPDTYVREVGADTVRAYLMFIGPWDQGGDWSDAGINGMARWMNRVWETCQRDAGSLVGDPEGQPARDTRRRLHQTIRKCYQDLDRFKFNTAIASLMELSNHLNRVWAESSIDPETWRECVRCMLLVLAPMAPHITEELWERAGYPYSIHNQPFPSWDKNLAANEVITLVVQVNGKVRDRLQVPAEISEEEARQLALRSEKVQAFVSDKQIERAVYVPGRLVNVVVKQA